MRKLAGEYNDIVVMEKIKRGEERIWYINKIVKNGWSRNVLLHQIETNLYKRQELNYLDYSYIKSSSYLMVRRFFLLQYISRK